MSLQLLLCDGLAPKASVYIVFESESDAFPNRHVEHLHSCLIYTPGHVTLQCAVLSGMKHNTTVLFHADNAGMLERAE